MNHTPHAPLDVLVIDDDDVAAEGILRSLRKCPMPMTCTTAQDGVEGLQILRGQHPEKTIEHPHLVLLDLNMPRMGGLEFLSHLRADEALHKTVVFVLSTSSRDADVAESYHQNVAGYMVKSKLGPQFACLSELLTSYGRSVSLPSG